MAIGVVIPVVALAALALAMYLLWQRRKSRRNMQAYHPGYADAYYGTQNKPELSGEGRGSELPDEGRNVVQMHELGTG